MTLESLSDSKSKRKTQSNPVPELIGSLANPIIKDEAEQIGANERDSSSPISETNNNENDHNFAAIPELVKMSSLPADFAFSNPSAANSQIVNEVHLLSTLEAASVELKSIKDFWVWAERLHIFTPSMEQSAACILSLRGQRHFSFSRSLILIYFSLDVGFECFQKKWTTPFEERDFVHLRTLPELYPNAATSSLNENNLSRTQPKVLMIFTHTAPLAYIPFFLPFRDRNYWK